MCNDCLYEPMCYLKSSVNGHGCERKLEKSIYFTLPENVKFEHSEHSDKTLDGFGEHYSCTSTYRLRINITGFGTTLEEARNRMEYEDNKFLEKYCIPYIEK